ISCGPATILPVADKESNQAFTLSIVCRISSLESPYCSQLVLRKRSRYPVVRGGAVISVLIAFDVGFVVCSKQRRTRNAGRDMRGRFFEFFRRGEIHLDRRDGEFARATRSRRAEPSGYPIPQYSSWRCHQTSGSDWGQPGGGSF